MKTLKTFLKGTDGVLGGVIYMVLVVSLATILAFALFPAMDMFREDASVYFAPASGVYQDWYDAASGIEYLIDWFYHAFVIMAFSGIFYCVLTPLKRMLYDKYARYLQDMNY